MNKSPQKRLERLWNGSRDSARTPVQWSDAEHAGFSNHQPWFYVNENYKEVNVASQEEDPNSVLNFYRQAIKLRKKLSSVRNGNYKEYNSLSKDVYMYSREDDKELLLVICSFSEKNVKLKVPSKFDLGSGELILKNYPELSNTELKPYETRVYKWNK